MILLNRANSSGPYADALECARKELGDMIGLTSIVLLDARSAKRNVANIVAVDFLER